MVKKYVKKRAYKRPYKKRFNKGRNFAVTSHKKTYKVKRVDQNDIVRFAPKKNMYFPNEMLTTFHQQYSFYTINGVSTAYFAIKLNSLNNPFNPTAVAGSATQILGTGASNTLITSGQANQAVNGYIPPGAVQLLGNGNTKGIYRNYCIYASTVTLSCNTGGVSQSIRAQIIPFNPAQTVFNVATNTYVGQAANMPYCKEGEYSVGKGKMVIRNSVTLPQLVGCTADQFNGAMVSYSINNQTTSPYAGSLSNAITDPTVDWYWQIILKGIDDVNWTGNNEMMVKVEYRVRMFNPEEIPLTS